MSGPAPKPTRLKILEGNPGHRPLNKREPQLSEGIRNRPAWLLPEAKREWVRVCGQLQAAGLLAGVDRAALAGYCQSWARMVEFENYVTEHGATTAVDSKANGAYEQPRPQVAMAQKYHQIMLSYVGKLGLSVADRSRLSAPEKQEDDLNALLG